MSRTTLCIVTAACLAFGAGSLMAGRYLVMGGEVKAPEGANAWKVRLVIKGRMTGPEARLLTSVPLDLGRQQLLYQAFHSDEMAPRSPDPRRNRTTQVLWAQRPGLVSGPFHASYQFTCSLPPAGTSTHTTSLARMLYVAPSGDQNLLSEPRLESDSSEITDLARNLTCGLENPTDQYAAFFRYVAQEVANEPSISGEGQSAVECMHAGAGDAAEKSRLLAALCRNRGIPARLVGGLTLRQGHEQASHVWVEAWINNHWVPACTVYHRIGRLPASYIVFAVGDTPLVRGRQVSDLDYRFLVEKSPTETTTASAGGIRDWLTRTSLLALPPAERNLVEFLLLLPVAALIVCCYRNLVGLASFGTFAPALIGLAFRDLGSSPGIIVFVSVVLFGWLLRKVLDRYHLLQVPRMAFLLSLVVIVLTTFIVGASIHGWTPTKYISLFPMVILTGMIERFWTLETEDGTGASFQTLLQTLLIAATISVVTSLHAVVNQMMRYPETLGFIMACQLLIGRYTGYRLLELFRFRDLIVENAGA
jgi:hypothetical protein